MSSKVKKGNVLDLFIFLSSCFFTLPHSSEIRLFAFKTHIKSKSIHREVIRTFVVFLCRICDSRIVLQTFNFQTLKKPKKEIQFRSLFPQIYKRSGGKNRFRFAQSLHSTTFTFIDVQISVNSDQKLHKRLDEYQSSFLENNLMQFIARF